MFFATLLLLWLLAKATVAPISEQHMLQVNDTDWVEYYGDYYESDAKPNPSESSTQLTTQTTQSSTPQRITTEEAPTTVKLQATTYAKPQVAIESTISTQKAIAVSKVQSIVQQTMPRYDASQHVTARLEASNVIASNSELVTSRSATPIFIAATSAAALQNITSSQSLTSRYTNTGVTLSLATSTLKLPTSSSLAVSLHRLTSQEILPTISRSTMDTSTLFSKTNISSISKNKGETLAIVKMKRDGNRYILKIT